MPLFKVTTIKKVNRTPGEKVLRNVEAASAVEAMITANRKWPDYKAEEAREIKP